MFRKPTFSFLSTQIQDVDKSPCIISTYTTRNSETAKSPYSLKNNSATENQHNSHYGSETDRFNSVSIFPLNSTSRTLVNNQTNRPATFTSSKHHVVVHWFGTCSCRKMQLKPKMIKKEHVCPLCSGELERVRFVGEEGTNPLDVLGVEDCWDKLLGDDGGVRWVIVPDRESFY